MDSFMDMPRDELSLRYNVNYVPAFIFIDEDDCFGEIARGGSTTVDDIKEGISDFECNNSNHDDEDEDEEDDAEDDDENEDGDDSNDVINSSSGGGSGGGSSSRCSTGCNLNGSCVSFGYRVNNTYCDLSKNFTQQKQANEICENNFECSTNLCIDEKCLSGNVWQKFIKWLSSIFG